MMACLIKSALIRVGVRLPRTSRQLLIVLGLALASVSHAATEVTWPEPRLPEGITIFALGQAMTVNGVPMRLQGFVSRQPPALLADAVRRSFGQPLVESTRGAKRILGRTEGRFYLTVQIEASGNGSKGIIATTDLGELAKNHQSIERAKVQWLDRLPAGSTIASDMRSDDGGKEARHTVIVNDQAPVRNRDAIVNLLTNEGYVLERETPPAVGQNRQAPKSVQDATSLHFRAPGKEAMAVIARSGSRTAIVLNTVSTLKADQ